MNNQQYLFLGNTGSGKTVLLAVLQHKGIFKPANNAAKKYAERLEEKLYKEHEWPDSTNRDQKDLLWELEEFGEKYTINYPDTIGQKCRQEFKTFGNYQHIFFVVNLASPEDTLLGDFLRYATKARKPCMLILTQWDQVSQGKKPEERVKTFLRNNHGDDEALDQYEDLKKDHLIQCVPVSAVIGGGKKPVEGFASDLAKFKNAIGCEAAIDANYKEGRKKKIKEELRKLFKKEFKLRNEARDYEDRGGVLDSLSSFFQGLPSNKEMGRWKREKADEVGDTIVEKLNELGKEDPELACKEFQELYQELYPEDWENLQKLDPETWEEVVANMPFLKRIRS